MRRPQSAKHGQKGIWAQMSSDDISDQQNNNNNDNNYYQHRKKVKIVKPDFITNDFTRLLPKKIHQDKQRLYSQSLQLKQILNETIQQNTRLKTKIAILQKEKDKMSKFIDSSDINSNANKSPSRVNLFSNKNAQKQNAMIRNLKKMIRQSKQQNQFLKQDNAKIKKAIKYSKINQLQIERKMLLQQNQRLNAIMEELNDQVNMQSDYQRQIRQLRKYLQQEVQNNKELSQSNQSYIQYIQSLEVKIKSQQEKLHEKQKRLQRDLALAKRKLNQQVKVSDQLRKQLRNIKQTAQTNDKKKTVQPINRINARPTSSNPYSKQTNQALSTSQILNKRQMQELKQKNQKLQKQLLQIKQKLKVTEDAFKRKSKTQNNNQKQNQESFILNQNIKNQKNQKIQRNQNFKNNDQPFIIQDKKENQNKDKNNSNIKPNQQLLNESVNKQNDYDDQNYQDQFQSPKIQKQKQKQQKQYQKQTMKKQSPSKKKINTEIQKYKKDFTQQAEQQKIYQKQPQEIQDKSNKNNKGNKKSQKKGKKEKSTNSTYKPDKKTLQSIKQLLTYRMKAQRYPFDQLEKDIIVSGQKKFQFIDLENMLKNQPFYLTDYYSSALLKYIFENDKLDKKSNTSQQNLIKKLRKVIQNFELISEKQEQQMLQRVVQMTSTYPKQLQSAFQNVKNGDGTLTKENLIQMFKKLQLADNYIELIITQLSLCSQDLQHLNYYGFFQRFYISEQGQGQYDNEGINMPIDQQQVQSSGGSSRHIKKSIKRSNQLQKIDQKSQKQKTKDKKEQREKDKEKEKDYQQYEQHQPQFVLGNDDKVQLSMGARDNESYLHDEDIVSDDGKI